MNLTDPRQKAAIEAAVSLINKTAAAVADRVSDLLGTLSISATRTSERDALLAAQFDLRRNMSAFHLTFRDQLRACIAKDLAPRADGRRRLEATDWQSLSLVGDEEVEQKLYADRIAAQIMQECEWEQSEVATHLASLLNTIRRDEDRNPLRPASIGLAAYRAIEAATSEVEPRKLLAREIGMALAKAMKPCYAEILQDLQARGLKAAGMNVRSGDGPGFHLPGVNSGYATLQHGEYRSTSGLGTDAGSDFGLHDSAASYKRGPGLAGLPPSPGGVASTRSGPASLTRAELGARVASVQAQADVHLMTLLRRLTVLASRPGALDPLPSGASISGFASTGRPGFAPDSRVPRGAGAASRYADGLTGLMAVNLIRAHREELMQASSGKLDHMVIDVVGSLFDQILSDPRVPPQMARQIARLQLPVLRVAMHDSTFFSSRRHPVRRFVNRIASLACAFDDFAEGPGKQLLDRVRQLVQEIVEGDFDQIELYTAKLEELEQFIGQQTQGIVQQTPAAATLENKESELRIQQRYMLQLATALKAMSLPPYLRDFISQVWSQALVLAVRRDGVASERYARFKRAGRDLVMSVQPKGSPVMRKKFLMQLPQLMKDLNEGMALIGWPDAAQKAFFAQLLPAHAESLKAPPLSELDHNLLAKQIEGVFNTTIPGVESLSVSDVVPEIDNEVIEKRFTPEEAKQVGLVEESAVDWSGTVDIELDTGDAGDTVPDDQRESEDSAPIDLGLDINLGLSQTEPPEPSRGPQLMDHIKLGFAYQMHLKDEWQKVRLTYVSPGRSFFVFSRGKKHQETISMTARMLARMCETGRMRAFESAYLMERATARARKQLAALKASPTKH
ncbi:DUF1631 family protein [uncultured Piscinibacter sp.]|uniref:DUF1631 family protein n=1 Tax=uncultured Piscinibacter sp. TaxID=1131835 RepID=UPI00260928D1|nr:DUF1631 family protein [uncultured Piscinibacter sp.]